MIFAYFCHAPSCRRRLAASTWCMAVVVIRCASPRHMADISMAQAAFSYQRRCWPTPLKSQDPTPCRSSTASFVISLRRRWPVSWALSWARKTPPIGSTTVFPDVSTVSDRADRLGDPADPGADACPFDCRWMDPELANCGDCWATH